MKGIHIFTIILVALTSGCAGKIYKSEGRFITTNGLSSYKYLVSNKTLRGEANMSSRTLSVEILPNVISQALEGAALKCGLAVISESQVSSSGENALWPSYAVSGRTGRGFGAYSQEVVVSLLRYSDKEVVYRGVGEYMGGSSEEDIAGATRAAMSNLCAESKFVAK